jgi:hypothetical protein
MGWRFQEMSFIRWEKWEISLMTVPKLLTCSRAFRALSYTNKVHNMLHWLYVTLAVGVLILDPIWRVNSIWSEFDPIRFESVPIRHDSKINGSGMGSIFFYLNRIGSGSGQPDPTRLIIFFEIILWFSTN